MNCKADAIKSIFLLLTYKMEKSKFETGQDSFLLNNLKNKILPEHMGNDYSKSPELLNYFNLKISTAGDSCEIMEIL